MRAETILVVEDNPLNLELVSDLLRSASYSVVEATSAEQALELALAVMPELVLLDIRLPGMDGLEAVQRLKQDVTARIPVVALTAQAMKGDEDAALAAGFSGYITKPINTRTFLDEVRRFLAATGDAESSGMPG